MQGIYNDILETNRVSRVWSVSAVLYLNSVLNVMLFRMLNVLYSYVNTFRSRCAVSNMDIFAVP